MSRTYVAAGSAAKWLAAAAAVGAVIGIWATRKSAAAERARLQTEAKAARDAQARAERDRSLFDQKRREEEQRARQAEHVAEDLRKKLVVAQRRETAGTNDGSNKPVN